MTEPPPRQTAASAWLSGAGNLALRAGRALGRGASRAYHAVDPDARRHIAQTPLLAFTLLAARQEQIAPGVPDGHPPLVFVHGLGGSRGDFLALSRYLWLHGRRRSYRIGFDAGDSIEHMAEALADFVRDVLRVTGEPRVQVVAHSLGGVVTRLAMLDHGLDAQVATLITLGSPHRGTHPARFAGTRAARGLRTDSDVVRRLNDAVWPEAVRGVSFWSRSDVLVQPPESAALEGTHQIDVTPFTHISYLLDPRCWALVRRELAR